MRLGFCSGISAGGEGGTSLILAVFTCPLVSTGVGYLCSPSLMCKTIMQCFFFISHFPASWQSHLWGCDCHHPSPCDVLKLQTSLMGSISTSLGTLTAPWPDWHWAPGSCGGSQRVQLIPAPPAPALQDQEIMHVTSSMLRWCMPCCILAPGSANSFFALLLLKPS